MLRVRWRRCWRSSPECDKELELGSRESPGPRRVVGGRALSRGLARPDLETPQEGSVEADLKESGKENQLPALEFLENSDNPRDSGQRGPLPSLRR